jgi:hypothetical protein
MDKQLKKYCEDNQTAIAMRASKSGEALIYVNPSADSKEVSKSLMIAMTEILKIKDGEQ